jgi:hypothetical protein
LTLTYLAVIVDKNTTQKKIVRQRNIYAAVAVGLILLLIILCVALYTFIAPTDDPTERKDFVQAYAVIVGGLAAFLTLLVGWRNLRHNQRTLMQSQESTEKTLENTRAIEVERAQNDTVQKYFEQMGQLLTKEGLRNSEKGSDVRVLARSQTLAVLATQRRGLEGGLGARKRFLLQFLYESRLIDSNNEIVSLAGADLRWVWLPEAELGGANLGGVDLRGANLGGANLGGVDLRGANLGGADLRGADLRGANRG